MTIQQALRLVTGLLVVSALVACGYKSDVKLCEAASDNFHTLYNDGKYSDIYNAAGERMVKSAPMKDWLDLMGRLSKRLGKEKSATPDTTNLGSDNFITVITLNYKTTFDKGDADEQFVYEIRGGKALLIGYQVEVDGVIYQ